MYGPMASNAIVVNLLMRWPVIIPIVAAIGITTVERKLMVPAPTPVVQIKEKVTTPTQLRALPETKKIHN